MMKNKYPLLGIFCYWLYWDIWLFVYRHTYMHQIYPPAILTTEEVFCSKCDWKGKGSDIKQEDLFLTDAIELFCPSCNGYLGFINQSDEDLD